MSSCRKDLGSPWIRGPGWREGQLDGFEDCKGPEFGEGFGFGEAAEHRDERYARAVAPSRRRLWYRRRRGLPGAVATEAPTASSRPAGSGFRASTSSPPIMAPKASDSRRDSARLRRDSAASARRYPD